MVLVSKENESIKEKNVYSVISFFFAFKSVDLTF